MDIFRTKNLYSNYSFNVSKFIVNFSQRILSEKSIFGQNRTFFGQIRTKFCPKPRFLIFIFMKANESLRGLGLRPLIFAVFGQRV